MIREWVKLLGLARKRSQSDADYLRFQTYQGSLVLRYIESQGVNLKGTRVLDLGCDRGGYSRVLSSVGADVISVDIRRARPAPPTLTLADATRLPFASESIPLILCASLIEHVPEPAQLLAEIRRALTPDGFVYLSFPPFYSPVGGHQFKPFHLLGEKWALRLSRHRVESFEACFEDWGLYRVSIRQARRLIGEAGMEIRDESTRFMPFNLARIPLIGEFLTWHIQFILAKA